MEGKRPAPAPGWGFLTPDDLTADLVQFVNGLDEIEETKNITADKLRHFKVKGFCIEERFLKRYFEYVEKGEFEARSSDVFIVSLPKTGTTWLREIVSLIRNGLNYEEALAKKGNEVMPFLEAQFNPKSTLLNAASPRNIQTHLPLELLPPSIMGKKCKILYIARNPKDTIVSFYHFCQLMPAFDFKGSFDDFVKFFLKGHVMFTPYHTHALQYWEKREEPNVLFVKYEELQKDLPKEIRKIASFLGNYLSNEQVDKLSKHCSLEEMRKNPLSIEASYKEIGIFKESGSFFRKGSVGDWKYHGNEETKKILEKYYDEKFKSKGLTFEFEHVK